MIEGTAPRDRVTGGAYDHDRDQLYRFLGVDVDVINPGNGNITDTITGARIT